jgi:hypothetical protein
LVKERTRGLTKRVDEISSKILSPQCSHIQDCHSRTKSELHDDIQHVLPGLVVLLPIPICRVESVDVDEVSVRVPEFLSYRLDDHSLPRPIVSQDADVPLLLQTVNQLLLFFRPEKNAADNTLTQKEKKTLLPFPPFLT